MDEVTTSVKTKNDENFVDELPEPTGDFEVNDTDDDEQDYNTNVFIYNAIQKSNLPEYQSDAESDDIWVKRYCVYLRRIITNKASLYAA